MPLAAEDLVLTIPEVSERLRIDRHTVTEMFKSEPGVIVIGSPETKKGKRKYRQFRVPTSVFNRVVARITVRGGR